MKVVQDSAPVTESVSRVSRNLKNQGMNWISQHKRLAIYLRDGLACGYCGKGIEEGTKLTLDHLTPYSKGGAITDETNLLTCCNICNSARGNRPRAHFVAALAAQNGFDAERILMNISNARRRVLDIPAAKAIIARRGSCFNAIAEIATAQAA
jgi:hypothetical protein